jgi:hypothetical protein
MLPCLSIACYGIWSISGSYLSCFQSLKELLPVPLCLSETLILMSLNTVSPMSSLRDMSKSSLFHLLSRCQVHSQELFSPHWHRRPYRGYKVCWHGLWKIHVILLVLCWFAPYPIYGVLHLRISYATVSCLPIRPLYEYNQQSVSALKRGTSKWTRY